MEGRIEQYFWKYIRENAYDSEVFYGEMIVLVGTVLSNKGCSASCGKDMRLLKLGVAFTPIVL